jgi:predicted dehydrogenase
VFFVEGLMYLSHPFIARLLQVLQDGRLGTLKSIHAQYAADIWQLVNPQGRGAIFNLGCYPVSLVQLVVQTLLGPDAFQARQSWGSGNISALDGNVSEALLGLRFDAGVLASVQTAETHGMGWTFKVVGSQGTLQCISNPWLPTADGNQLLWTPFNGSAEQIHVVAEGDAFDYQVRMVEQHIRRQHRIAARPAPQPRDSLEIMALLAQWEAHARDAA